MTETIPQILEGIITVGVSIIAVFGTLLFCTRRLKYFPFIPFPVMFDFPATATFLTPEERAYVIWRKSKLLTFLHHLWT